MHHGVHLSVHVIEKVVLEPSFGTKWYVGTMLNDSARSGAGLPSGNGLVENSSPRDRVTPPQGAVERDLHVDEANAVSCNCATYRCSVQMHSHGNVLISHS